VISGDEKASHQCKLPRDGNERYEKDRGNDPTVSELFVRPIVTFPTAHDPTFRRKTIELKTSSHIPRNVLLLFRFFLVSGLMVSLHQSPFNGEGFP
jgi:hypothetical protein